MDAIVLLAALVIPILGALAVRVGRESREGFRSDEHALAALDVSRIDPERGRGVSAPGRATATATVRPAYPTLAVIERGLGVAPGSLTAAPDAERLEDLARVLTAEAWSDAVWTTGVVPAAAFRRVVATLAPGLLDAADPTDPSAGRTGALVATMAGEGWLAGKAA